MEELNSFLHNKYDFVSYESVLKDKSSVDFLNVNEMLDFSNFKENKIVKLKILSRSKDYAETLDITFEPEYGVLRLLSASVKINYKTGKAENKAILSSFFDDFFIRSRSTYWYVYVLNTYSIIYFLWFLLILIGIVSGFLSFPPDFSKPLTGGDFLFIASFVIALNLAPWLINKSIIALFPPIVFEWGEERNREKTRQQRKSNVVWLIISTIIAFILPWLFGLLFK